MKKTVKSIIKLVLVLAVVVSLVMATGSHSNMNLQFIWSIGWMLNAVLCGKVLFKLCPELNEEESL